MKGLKKIYLIIGGVLFAIAGVLAFFSIFVEHNTEYAAGWSDEGFKNLRTGDDLEAVLGALGPPLSVTINPAAVNQFPFQKALAVPCDFEGRGVFMQFSKPKDGDDFYRNCGIWMENGHLTGKLREVYQELW